MTEALKVAVWMVTYNHEQFLRQSIEGILNQQTNFTFKLFIGEDCSTDKTRDICIEFKERYPEKIELVLRDHNVGATQNGVEMYKICFASNAPYITLCEGDDYWTDPLKLQKQVDFLDANPDFSICYHRVNVLNPNMESQAEELNSSLLPKVYTIEDLAHQNIIFTPSVMFRNNLAGQLRGWLLESPVGDYVLHMLNARYGKIYYMPDIMAVYRIHNNGVWSTKSEKYRTENWIVMLRNLVGEFKNENTVLRILKNKLAEHLNYLAELNRAENATQTSIENIKEAFAVSDSFTDTWIKNHYDLVVDYDKLRLKYNSSFFVRLQRVVKQPDIIINKLFKRHR